MQLNYDQKLLVAFGRSRKAAHWQNKEILWSELVKKLSTTTRTRESVSDYAALSKTERDSIKDVGGFVGGYLISQCTQSNGLVLDAFLGSASTLIACEQLNRSCFGIEMEPKFVDVAVKRYLQLKNDDASDVYVIRNGQKIGYADITRSVENT